MLCINEVASRWSTKERVVCIWIFLYQNNLAFARRARNFITQHFIYKVTSFMQSLHFRWFYTNKTITGMVMTHSRFDSKMASAAVFFPSVWVSGR